MRAGFCFLARALFYARAYARACTRRGRGLLEEVGALLR